MNNHSTAPLLARALREAFSEGTAHSTAFFERVIDLRPHEAAATPIAGAASIWTLASGVWSALRATRLRVLGGMPEPAALAPAPAERDEPAGYALLQDLQAAEARLRELLIRQEPARFEPGSPEFDCELFAELLSVIALLAESGGQIAILRQAQGLSAIAGAGPRGMRTDATP